MDFEKMYEKLKELIIGEIKEELKEFKATVSGQLQGFALAIESINARLPYIENEIRDIRRAIETTNNRIDETNKRIDELRVELKNEIMENTRRIDETNKRIDETNKRIDETNKRIDETNKRIDELYLEISDIKAQLQKALSEKEVINDVLIRVQRLEEKVYATA